VAECPPSRRSGGIFSSRRYGETAFACLYVRGPVAGGGSNRCRGSAFARSASFGETSFACQSVASVVAGLFT